MRWLVVVAAVVASVALSGCPGCQPGWTFTWTDPAWAEPLAGTSWDTPAGAPVVWPDGAGRPETWVSQITQQGPVRVEMYERHGTWRLVVGTSDEAVARATAEAFLRPLHGNATGAVLDSLRPGLPQCEEETFGCEEPHRSWSALPPAPDLPTEWLREGTLEESHVGSGHWRIGDVTFLLQVRTYEAHEVVGNAQVRLTGDAYGTVEASVWGMEQMSEAEARERLRAVTEGRVVPFGEARAGDCYL